MEASPAYGTGYDPLRLMNAVIVRARLARVWLFPKARRYRKLFERLGKKFGRRKLGKRTEEVREF